LPKSPSGKVLRRLIRDELETHPEARDREQV
jgi:acyl-coenzyme A synthetase/AMP-(fatty) acid ligase